MSTDEGDARLVEALEAVRDHYVCVPSGQREPICTLCGGKPGDHGAQFNCGRIEAALAAHRARTGGGRTP